MLDLIHPDVNAKVRVSQEKQQENFNNKIAVREFSVGQQVWVQTFSKNSPKWSIGTIIKPVGPVSYIVNVEGREMKRHVDHIISALGQRLEHKSTIRPLDEISNDPKQIVQADEPKSPVEPPVLENPVVSPARPPPVPTQQPSPEVITLSDDEDANVRRYPHRSRSQRKLHNVSSFN